MPRITTHEHFRRHRFVRMLFTETGMQILFALIPLSDQYELHHYYATDHDFAPDEFDSYRRAIDKVDPSLRHKAGTYFKVIEDAFITVSCAQGITPEQTHQAVANAVAARNLTPLPIKEKEEGERKKSPSRSVQVVPIGRPLDPQRLATAVRSLAQWQMQQEREKAEAAAASSSSSDQLQTDDLAESGTTLPPEDAEPPRAAAA